MATTPSLDPGIEAVAARLKGAAQERANAYGPPAWETSWAALSPVALPAAGRSGCRHTSLVTASVGSVRSHADRLTVGRRRHPPSTAWLRAAGSGGGVVGDAGVGEGRRVLQEGFPPGRVDGEDLAGVSTVGVCAYLSGGIVQSWQ